MAPSRPSKPSQTKGKRAPRKSGIANSKAASRRTPTDGIVSRSRSQIKKQQSTAGKPKKPSAPSLAELLKKRKPKTYAEKDLDLPKLNTVVPAGVTKPKGQKKGKVFVDDREGMATILALVQAEQDGQIESRMARARQLEEVREARRAEAEKKEGERRAALDDVKESLRKKRRRPGAAEPKKVNENNINELAITGTRAAKTAKKRKSVSFAE